MPIIDDDTMDEPINNSNNEDVQENMRIFRYSILQNFVVIICIFAIVIVALILFLS